MCGISGIITFNKNFSHSKLSSDLKKMVEEISHRGPDGEGVWIKKNVFLAHKRLSVIDLSDNAKQPMISRCGRYVLNFNGEIYNYLELKESLKIKGYIFFSNSDTEVLLNSYIEWGDKFLKKLNGMFAFSIFDNKTKNLLLARDRFGTKPLYISVFNDTLYYSSEIKSFFKIHNFKKEINLQSLSQYLIFQNILSNDSLYKNIRLVPAGSFLNLTKNNINEIRFQKFWDFNFEEDNNLSEAYCIDKLKHLLENSIKKQTRSDVEIGTYLSGGIDSGLINLINSKKSSNTKSFTCGFDLSSASGIEMNFDERQKSESLSNICKTEHYEMVLKAGDMEKSIKSLNYILDEPRIGQSYPNYYVAKLASKFVKVVLSGVGGDEIFGGYPWRYFYGFKNDNLDKYLDNYFNFWQKILNLNELEKLLVPIKSELKNYQVKEQFKNVFKPYYDKELKLNNMANLSLYFESKTFLNGLLLVEDRISMAHGMETRLPFLDNDLVEFAQKIPLRFKIKNLRNKIKFNENFQGNKRENYFSMTSSGKNILRKVMKKYYNNKIFNLPKQGFSSPDASWFKGESINFVRQNLLDKDLNIYNYLDYNFTKQKIKEHCDGKKNNRLFIWSMLSLKEVLNNI